MSKKLLLTETCKFKLKPTEEQIRVLEELFTTYTEMVKTCFNFAIKNNVTSRKKLHKLIYRKLRSKFPDYPSHYVYTAITQALSIFKSYRRLSRKRRNIKQPEIEVLNVVLLDDTHLFWFNWKHLKIATHKGHQVIPLIVHEYSEKFRGWKVKGSRLVRKDESYWLHITFRKEIEAKQPHGVLGIDVNEKSIDLAVVKPNYARFIKIDISEAKYVRDRYFKKRRNIQRKTRRKRRKLLAKYCGREKRRVDYALHKASKIIAEIVAEENVRPVMEKLKNIRGRIRYGRKMNRRLHSMPFRKTQLYISYKSMEFGYEHEKINAKNTSRICPICGELNKPNGQLYRCKKCGFEADRHLVAAWNIGLKSSMWGALPFPPKAAHDLFKSEVERIVIKC